MSIERLATTCIVVHLAASEAHFPDAQQAEAWIERLPAEIIVRAIEPAQTPCWMAYCDEPACGHAEGDENDNPTHIPGHDQAEVEALLDDLKRVAGVVLCTVCREDARQPATTADHH